MAEPATIAEPAGITLRAGTPDDVGAIRALAEAVLPPTYEPVRAGYPALMLAEWWTPERIAFSLERNRHVLAEHDGRVVAMANLGRLSQSHRDFPGVTGDREVMWKLYLHPDVQGRGLGTRLLTEVERLVEGDELWVEVVDGNESAAAFYRARGFVEVERAGNGPWPDDVWFRKELR